MKIRKSLYKKDIKKARIEGIPIFKCTGSQLRTCIQLIFFCPFCQRKHFHGLGSARPFEISHRVAHCTSPSVESGFTTPLKRSGYYVYWDSTFDN